MVKPSRTQAAKAYNERGSGTALVMAALIVGCLLAGLVLVGGAYASRAQQVSQAADLVALSAATHGCQQAEQVASENQVALKSCEQVGDVFDQVTTAVVTGEFAIFGFQHEMEYIAYAGKLAA